MATHVSDEVEQVGDSTTLEEIARVGLSAYGIVHLLIGLLALQIAWGSTDGGSADTSGAMKTLAEQPIGKILLWLVAIGLVGLALWQASEVIWGYRHLDGAKRTRKQITSGAKGVVYAALAASAVSVTLGSGSSSSQTQQHTTAGVLAWPAGQVIVVAAALIIVAVGVAGVVKGTTMSFAEEIDTSSMPPALCEGVARMGQVGYIAKGLALTVVGGLVGYAALTFDQQKTRGLDGAVQTILAQPFGRFLLTAVALGFIAFGLFTILQSRYRQM